jgi:flagellar motor switch protein FliM
MEKKVINEMNELFTHHKSASLFERSRCHVDLSVSGRPQEDRAERLQRMPETDGRGEAK